MAKLIVAFRSFANATENTDVSYQGWYYDCFPLREVHEEKIFLSVKESPFQMHYTRL